MTDNRTFFRSQTLLSLALGIFFMIAGAQALAQHTDTLGNAVVNFLGVPHEPPFLKTTFAIVEFISGVVMFLSPFGFIQLNVAGVAIFTVALLWLAKTILEFFVFSKPFTPNGFDWWKGLSLNVVLLVSIWHLRPREVR
ncbi:MAG: hypothetical protein HKM05_12030 [Spirochaetales bacterium]|nr:hypothetical protein [Spirochaetales bacterium]